MQLPRDKSIFRDAGPVILRLEGRGVFRRLDALQFRRAAVSVFVVMAVLGMVTWGRVRVLANAYQIMELKADRDALLAEQRRLERRLNDMQSLNYVEAIARQRLGMVDINPNQVIALRKRGATESLVDSVAGFFKRSPPAPKTP
jgi:cell division protein FtsB